MQLTGIDVSATMRVTQPNDATDIQIALLNSMYAQIHPAFYTLLFFDLMNGTLTGKDEGSVTTGISFKVVCADGSELVTTPVTKLDWYESAANYFVEALSSTTLSLTENKKIHSVEVYYTANKEGSAEPILIISTEAPAHTAFSVSAEDGTGIPLDYTKGDVTITCKYLTQISK